MGEKARLQTNGLTANKDLYDKQVLKWISNFEEVIVRGDRLLLNSPCMKVDATVILLLSLLP